MIENLVAANVMMFFGMLLMALSVALAGAAEQARSLGFKNDALELFRVCVLCAVMGAALLYTAVPKVKLVAPSINAEVMY